MSDYSIDLILTYTSRGKIAMTRAEERVYYFISETAAVDTEYRDAEKKRFVSLLKKAARLMDNDNMHDVNIDIEYCGGSFYNQKTVSRIFKDYRDQENDTITFIDFWTGTEAVHVSPAEAMKRMLRAIDAREADAIEAMTAAA